MKKALAIELVSPHFVFRHAKLRCTPIEWEEYTRFGEAMDELPPASELIDNHAEIELLTDYEYRVAMTNLVIDTVSGDRTFKIPFYFQHSNLLFNEETAGQLRISIDASVVYRVTLLDRIERPVESGTLTIVWPKIPITLSPQLGKEGSILFLGNPTGYVFDLGDEFGLKILPA